MQIRELTIENIINVLNSFKYDNTFFINKKFWLNDYKIVTDALIKYFFDTYTKVDIINIETPKKYSGHKIIINDNKLDRIIHGVYRVSFDNMYPNIFIKLFENGDIKFSVVEYYKIYKFMVNNKIDIINHCNMVDISHKLLNSVINMLYLATMRNEDSCVKTSSFLEVITYSDKVVTNLDGLILSNIDELYLEICDDKTINALNSLNLPYEIDILSSGYFIAKQKFMICVDGEIKFKGMKNPYKQNRRGKKYKQKYIDVMNKMNIIMRSEKIDKIMSRIC